MAYTDNQQETTSQYQTPKSNRLGNYGYNADYFGGSGRLNDYYYNPRAQGYNPNSNPNPNPVSTPQNGLSFYEYGRLGLGAVSLFTDYQRGQQQLDLQRRQFRENIRQFNTNREDLSTQYNNNIAERNDRIDYYNSRLAVSGGRQLTRLDRIETGS